MSINPVSKLKATEQHLVSSINATADAVASIGTVKMDESIHRLQYEAGEALQRLSKAQKTLEHLISTLLDDYSSFANTLDDSLAINARAILPYFSPVPFEHVVTEEEELAAMIAANAPNEPIAESGFTASTNNNELEVLAVLPIVPEPLGLINPKNDEVKPKRKRGRPRNNLSELAQRAMINKGKTKGEEKDK